MNSTGWGARLTMPVSPQRDHILGPVDAPVSLLEYGDYECPFCAGAHPIVDAITSRMNDAMHFVFRHFPMTTVHPHAVRAATAAEAAGSQGRFWPMHRLLFEGGRDLTPPRLYGYAEALRLDMDRFHEELGNGAHTPKIREDFMSGVRSGVNGTPTFYINGTRYDGSWDLETLLLAVRRAEKSRVRG